MTENPFKPTRETPTPNAKPAARQLRDGPRVHRMRVGLSDDVPRGVGDFNRVPAGQSRKRRSKFMDR